MFAFLVRLPLLPYPGFFTDLQTFVSWGKITDAHFWHFYSVAGNAGTIANYPPLAVYLFGLQVRLWVHGQLMLGQHISLNVSQSPALAAWMKLPMLAADLLTIVLIHRQAHQALSERKALIVTAAYAFNPGIVIMSALWGQLESVFLLFLLLSLLATLNGQTRHAGIYLALACLVKPQPLIFIPLVFVWLYRHIGRHGTLEASVAFIAVSLVGWLPYLLPLSLHPEVLAFLHNLAVWESRTPASAAASNLWWLLNPRFPGQAPLIGPLSPDILGALFFAPMFVLALVGVWRNRSSWQLFLSAVLIQVASFDVLALQRSRFLYPALALALLAALTHRRLWLAFGALWLTLSLNLIFNVLIPGDTQRIKILDPVLAQWSLAHQPLLQVCASMAAWVNLAVLLWIIGLQVAQFRRQLASQPEQRLTLALGLSDGSSHPSGAPQIGRIATQAYRTAGGQLSVSQAPPTSNVPRRLTRDTDLFAQPGAADLTNLGRYQEALAAAEQAITLQPGNASAWITKAFALINLGRYQEGLAAAERAITLQPDAAIAWYNKGTALYALERYEEALAAYDRATFLTPNYANDWGE
jgi:tetratricopeptide (TPR) repeat protein